MEQYKQQLAGQLFQSNILLEEIRWVDLNHSQIQFADGGCIFVTAIELSAVGMNDASAAIRLTAGAIANGWRRVELSGSDSFIHKAAFELLNHGIEPNVKNPEQQKQIDQARGDYERFRAAIDQADSENESRTGFEYQGVEGTHSAVSKAVNATILADRKIEWADRRRERGKEEISGIFCKLERFRMGFSQKISELNLEVRKVISTYLKIN